MPPIKKKKKSKKGKGQKGDKNGGDTCNNDEEKKKEELIQRATTLENESNSEEAAIDEFCQRLEKFRFFWDVEKMTLEKRKEVLQQKKALMHSTQDDHRTKVDAKRQEIKLLLSKQEDKHARAEMETQANLKALRGKHQLEENELISDRNECHAKLRENELSHDDMLKRLQDEHSSQITKLRNDFRHRSADIASYSERQLKRTRDELEAKKRRDIKQTEHNIEDRVGQVLSRHEKEIEESRQHYNNIVHENLDNIKSLKDEVVRLRKEQRQREKVLDDVTANNCNIVQPLSHGTREVERLVEQDEICKRQKEALRIQEERLSAAQEDLNKLKFRHEVLFQKYEAVEKERETLRRRAR